MTTEHLGAPPEPAEWQRFPPQPEHAPPQGPPAPSHSRLGPIRSAVLSAAVAAVVAAGVTVPVARWAAPFEDAQDITAASPVRDEAGTAAGAMAAATIAQVAAAVSPSVAYVEVASRGIQGGGSAVIIDPGGYLLTNAHVVEGATEINVTLPDGTRADAALVGLDQTSDIAVLHIEATGLPALTVGDDIEVGESVVAIGSPFGLEGSVTSGIISGLDRTLRGGPGQAALLGVIQTDAAINPGNSGGALVDLDGQLVGINTAIYSATGTSSGVGFAIPAATAMAVADQIISGIPVAYAQLGINGIDVNAELAAAYDLAVEDGALVVEVLPRTAAAEAGLQAGDVIIGLDGDPVTSMTELTALIRRHRPGDAVTVRINRSGDELDLQSVLGSAS